MLNLFVFVASVLTLVSSRALDAPYYEINSTVLAEAIIGMQEGRISYPQWNPHSLPEFNFRCEDQPLPGFYADPDFDCQVVHQCDQEREISGYHICPNMTVFHQVLFTCFWAPFVDCQSSSQFYYLNEQLYVEPQRPATDEIQDNYL